MSDVASLDEYRPHLSGPAKCNGCGHEWAAVSPVGVVDGLQCPSCEREMGGLIYEVVPDEHWQCDCGSGAFWLLRGGAMCRVCGTRVIGWNYE